MHRPIAIFGILALADTPKAGGAEVAFLVLFAGVALLVLFGAIFARWKQEEKTLTGRRPRGRIR